MKKFLSFAILLSFLLALSFCQEQSVVSTSAVEESFLWEELGSGPSNYVDFIERDSIVTMYVVGDNTLFRTIDDGRSWDKLREIFPRSLMVGPSNRLFLGTGVFGIVPGVIQYSDDSGVIWHYPQTPPRGGAYSSFTYSKWNTVFVSSINTDESGGGLFSSNDNGVNWGEPLIEVEKTVPMAVHNSSRDKIYAITYEPGQQCYTLLKSTNEGESWETISLPDSANDSFRHIAVNNDGRLFVTSRNSGIISTMNDGGNWQFHGFEGHIFEKLYIDDQSNLFILLKEAYAEPIRLYGSNNAGISWKALDLDFKVSDPEFRSIQTLRNGYILLGTKEHGILKSTIPVDSIFGVL